jgi:hypothetical protein
MRRFMTPTLIRRIASTTVLVMVLCVALVGCLASDHHSIIWIENRTDTVVSVYLVGVAESDFGSRVVAGMDPGQGYSYFDIAEGCTDLHLVAKDAASGAVVARSPTPVCRPSTWTIER